MIKLCDTDIPLCYVNDDIKDFPNFNGFSKVYMYDKVFTTDVMQAIANSFNASTSVKMIASTKDLIKYGFDVNLITTLGSLKARGGKMSHTWNVYESKRYSHEWLQSDIPVKKLADSIEVAISKQMRFEQTESLIYAYHNSEKSPRLYQVNQILNIKQVNQDVSSARLLFDQMTCKSSVTINQTLFTQSRLTCTRKSSTYELFNLKELHKLGRSEASAVTHKPTKTALIVPSYDGKEYGQILVGIIVDSCRGTNNIKYCGCVYNTGENKFHEIPLSSIMSSFEIENSFPPGIDLELILQVFSLCYFLII